MKQKANYQIAIVAALVFFATVAGCAYFWRSFERNHAQELRDAENRNQVRALQLDEAVSQQFDATLRSVDAAMQYLRLVYVKDRGGFAREAQAVLAAFPTGMLRAFTVFGADGRLVYSTDGQSGRFDFSDREHFRVHADSNGDRLFLSKPIVGRLEAVPLVPLSRPIRDKGRFLGVIAAPLYPGYLAEKFSALRVAPEDLLAIVRNDGSFIARNHRLDEALKTRLPPNRPFLVAKPGEHGVFRDVSTVDKVPLLFSWRRLSEWPVSVVVAINEQTELSALRASQESERFDTLASILVVLVFSASISILLLRLSVRNAELARSEARARAIFESSPVPSAMNDAEGNITYLNPAFTDTFGYTRQDLPSLNDWWPKAYPDPQYREWVMKAWQDRAREAQRSAKPFEPLEVDLRCRDGTIRTVLAVAKPLDSSLDQGHLVTLYDITARRELEDAQRQLSQAVEQSPVSIVVTDLQGNIEQVNRAFCQVTGYSREEVIGSNPRILKSGHTGQEEYRQMWAALSSGRSWQGIFRNRRKDGTLFWESAQVSPVLDSSGRITHYLGIKVDITQQREASEALQKALTDAEAATLAKSQFLATMSHEIRTPMNGIMGMAQLLLEPNLTEAERADYARMVYSSGQTLLTLLNDILDLSKIEANRVEIESVVFMPQQIVREIRALFAQSAADKGLVLQERGHSGPEQRYLGDPLRLRQMLSNLVSNAIKFTEQGAVTVEVTAIGGEAVPSMLEFSVTDTGIGVAEEQRARLFQPFSQADSSTTRRFGGTGLGLSIVRSLAELMGGEAGFDPVADGGSRFWFRVRAKPVRAGQDSRYRARSDEVKGEWRGDEARFSGRVLVVEDNLINRRVIAGMLAKMGFEVEQAEDGEQGVMHATGPARPDLVFMDVHMPVFDGLEATRRIRAWERERRQLPLRIIALTADAYDDDRARCLEAGMDDYLTKPIDGTALRRMLAKWIRGPDAPHLRADAAGASPRTFDAALMLARMEHDRPLAEMAVRQALDAIPGYFDVLRESVVDADWKEARRRTHNLKGLVAQVGGVALAELLRAADERLKAGETVDLDTVDELRRNFAELADALNAWLSQ